MKIETLQDRNVHTIGDQQEVTNFSISEEAMGMFFKTFSDSLYSDKYGSIVREIASNCFDAHRQANLTKNIQIELVKSTNEHTLIFRDFGVGMHPDLIKNIYSKYFESTKRSSNDEIGGWGIGAKSPFAYTDAFTVITWVDNIKYTYVLHRAEVAPQIRLVDKSNDVRENGTEVHIPVKANNVSEFVRAIKTQLVFFDNIDYINIPGISYGIDVLKGKNFVCSFNSETKEPLINTLCIYLGGVNYPANVSAVYSTGILDRFSLHDIEETQVALRFEIGELPVTLSRENIEYKEGIAEKIANRFLEMVQELQEFADKSLVETDSLEVYMKNRRDHGFYIGDFNINIPSSIVKKNIVFTPLKGIPNLRIPSNPFFEFKVEKGLRGENIVLTRNKRRYNDRHYFSDVYSEIFENKRLLLRYRSTSAGKYHNLHTFEVFKGVKVKNYIPLVEHCPESDTEARRTITENGKSPVSLEELKKYRQVMLTELVKHTHSYTDKQYVPSAEWIKQAKDQFVSKKNYRKQEITFRILNHDSYYLDNCTIEAAKQRYGILIYCDRTQEDTLKALFKIRRYLEAEFGCEQHSIYFAKVATTNLDKIPKEHPFMSVDYVLPIVESLAKKQLRYQLSRELLHTSYIDFDFFDGKKLKSDVDTLRKLNAGVDLDNAKKILGKEFPITQEYLDTQIPVQKRHRKDKQRYVSFWRVYSRLQYFMSHQTVLNLIKPSEYKSELAQQLVRDSLLPKFILYGYY